MQVSDQAVVYKFWVVRPQWNYNSASDASSIIDHENTLNFVAFVTVYVSLLSGKRGSLLLSWIALNWPQKNYYR